MLDDPTALAGTELLARYDAIGKEISRREGAGARWKNADDRVPARLSGAAD
jgi:hypothetical protein